MALMRLVMNPGDSLIRTTSLPMRRPTAETAAMVSSSVSTARSTSMSFILCTGLKKCIPTHLLARNVTLAISVMLNDDVFEARIVPGRQILSSSVKNLDLRFHLFRHGFDHKIRFARGFVYASGIFQPR